MDSQAFSVTADNLFTIEHPLVTDFVTVAESQTLKRGTVMGIITVGGEALKLDIAAVDGSEDFHSILTADVTTGAGETKVAPVAVACSVMSQGLIMGGATTVADIKVAARLLSCYIQNSVADENLIGG